MANSLFRRYLMGVAPLTGACGTISMVTLVSEVFFVQFLIRFAVYCLEHM